MASAGGWPDKDYRIPDLVVVSPERIHLDRNEYFEGAPDVVVDIRSPGDETYQKLDFYAKLGVPEVWIVDRDTKESRILCLQNDTYDPVAPTAEGWLQSPQTGIQLKNEAQKLLMRLGVDESTRTSVPED